MATQLLPFRIITLDGGQRVKVRDDGRRGATIGDEVALWDALQETAAEREQARADLQEALKENQELLAELATRPKKGKPNERTQRVPER